jgi:hypothetical protein
VRVPAKLGLEDPRFKEAEMSTLYRAESSRTADAFPSAADARHIDGGGAYLTDDVFLYRVVDFVAGASGAMVELEDCYRLDVVRVPVSDLRARRLRVVTPTRAEG